MTRVWLEQTKTYPVLILVVAVATGVLGFFTLKNVNQQAQLGEQAIAQAMLTPLSKDVEQIESTIIKTDNRILHEFNPEAPGQFASQWRSQAHVVSPIVRALVVFENTGRLLDFNYRGTPEEASHFKNQILGQLRVDLQIATTKSTKLQHLHTTYGTQSTLVSHQALPTRAPKFHVVIYYDTAWILQTVIREVLENHDGKHIYNVMDNNNRVVYGQTLANAGDYTVGRRFPTTLYQWRLQMAPRQAAQLDAQSKNQRFSELTLVVFSLAIVLLGVAFILVAVVKDRKINQLKSEFVSTVSHELKTPVSVIRMFGDMLRSGKARTPKKREQYIEVICRETERLSALVDNVLDFEAMEQGERRYALTPQPIYPVIEAAVDAMGPRLEQENITLDLQLPKSNDDEPGHNSVGPLQASPNPTVPLDREAALLALVNLIDNAIKYGNGTPITITTRVYPQHVEIRVMDRGPGIPVEQRVRVFDRFYRAAHQSGIRGTGIGLALVKSIATAHRGWIRVDSVKPHGVCMTLGLPTHNSTHPKPTGEHT